LAIGDCRLKIGPLELERLFSRTAAIVLEYHADGRMAINNQPVTVAELHDRLSALFRERSDKTLFVMGDSGLAYGTIIEAIDIAKGAGVDKVGIVTESMRRQK
jgi:biopolymer transport protein TolR